jgi:hypothetical protein
LPLGQFQKNIVAVGGFKVFPEALALEGGAIHLAAVRVKDDSDYFKSALLFRRRAIFLYAFQK